MSVSENINNKMLLKYLYSYIFSYLLYLNSNYKGIKCSLKKAHIDTFGIYQDNELFEMK